MNKFFIAAIACLTLAAAANNASAAEEKDVPVSILTAFISGFDSNSDAHVVIQGILPNGCYRLKKAYVKHVGPSLHEVEATATVFQGECIMVLAPYNKEVSLGKLAKGDNTIKLMNGDGTYWEKHVVVGE